MLPKYLSIRYLSGLRKGSIVGTESEGQDAGRGTRMNFYLLLTFLWAKPLRHTSSFYFQKIILISLYSFRK